MIVMACSRHATRVAAALAVVDLADAMDPSGVEQDPLGQRGLARVDVGRDAEVAHARQRQLERHACRGSEGSTGLSGLWFGGHGWVVRCAAAQTRARGETRS
jgi:hypothetical protein